MTAAIKAMLVLALTVGGPASAMSTDGLMGRWGGDHIALSITAHGAQLELDCGSGGFTMPTSVDAHGKFSAQGTLRLYNPGPTRADEQPGASAAFYNGRLDGDRMTLDVVTAAPAGHRRYVLTRNTRVKLVRCL